MEGYAFRTEWIFWVFEALPMVGAIGIFGIFHPSSYLSAQVLRQKGNSTEFVELSQDVRAKGSPV